MTTPHVTTVDTDNLLGLMREYTAKLREICDTYAEARYRRVQLTVASLLLAMTAGMAFWLVPSLMFIETPDRYQQTILMLVGAIAASALAAFSIFAPSSRRTVYDAHSLASVVEELVRTVSQYHEHTNLTVSSRLEVTLRLAEADAAIRVYKQIFGGRSGVGAIFP